MHSDIKVGQAVHPDTFRPGTWTNPVTKQEDGSRWVQCFNPPMMFVREGLNLPWIRKS